MLITANMIDTTAVTAEDMDRAQKCYDGEGKPFYMVENSRGLLNADGSSVEYKVTHTEEEGFKCTCKAGEFGFWNCSKKVCQHCIISLACAKRERAEEKALQAKEQAKQQAVKEAEKIVRAHHLEINGTLASDEEYNRVMNAKPAPTKKAPTPARQGFSLMR